MLSTVLQKIFIRMQHWAGKVALVTGASGGIGAQITTALAKNGMKVIGVARRLDKLKELAADIKRKFKIDVYPMECDVQKEEDILKIFKYAEEKLGGVDVMINNAGLLFPESIIDGSTENYRKIMDVNVIAMAICSRELVQSVKKRKARGHIININSVVGHYGPAYDLQKSLYSASKYAVTGMTHSLHHEIRGAKIDVKVTSISPGAVDTEMLRVGFPSAGTDGMVKLNGSDVADAIIYALSAPHYTQVAEVIVLPHQAAVDVLNH